ISCKKKFELSIEELNYLCKKKGNPILDPTQIKMQEKSELS
ncbi:8945_t:CDS:1, partial [Gigaspora margarita]